MNGYRRVLIDGVLLPEVVECKDEHANGVGMLSITLKFNAKKIEIDTDVIRITSYKPSDATEKP